MRCKVRRNSKFCLIFFLSLAVCVTITGVYINNKNKMEHAQMEQLVLLKSNKINNVIANLLYKTQVLRTLVIQNNGEVKNFEQIAATVLDNPAIRNLLLAPNGIVKEVYPLAGNEDVLGLNYFTDGEGNKEAITARQSGKIVLGGPFNLVQGGQALVGRLPVYLGAEGAGNHFWGIVSITLNYPEALAEAELDQLANQGFAFEIWRISPDTGQRQVIASSNYDYDKGASYVEKPLHIMNAEWFFRVSPIRVWHQYPETWIFTLIGMIISWLIASLITHNQELLSIKAELEKLSCVDSLTGALNRRGLFNAVKELLADQKRKFIVCYLDLNKFKEANDTFGHAGGDKILRYFSRIFLQHMDENHIFSRVGGDEFIVVFKDTDDVAEVEKFFASINQRLKEPIVMDGSKAFTVTFSKGIAVYPKDSADIDDLISHADVAMYKEKG